MDKIDRHKIKKVLMIISLVWLTIGTWVLFINIPADEIQTMHSQGVKDRMRDECTGSFHDRYQCKEDIVLEVTQDTFANMALRTMMLVSLPLLLTIGYNTILRSNPIAPRQHLLVHHVPTAVHEIHAPEHHEKAHPPSQPVKPVDDWKKRAQQRVTNPMASVESTEEE